ncbi:MAG: inosine/xanthosine triphosphatase [Candidatus Diapherotrites archaeon]
MKIVVGSSNPIKVEAVRSAVKKIWPNSKVLNVEVESGIGEQPQGDEEAINGAFNRALAALKKTGADFGVGLEGTTVETKKGMFLCGWVVVVDNTEKMGLACTSKILLPEKIAKEVRLGGELGPIMDKISGEKDVKKKHGAVGILTKGLVTRKDAFEQAVLCAFARFISKEYYE